jgi:FixJ family two-component response regulator
MLAAMTMIKLSSRQSYRQPFAPPRTSGPALAESIARLRPGVRVLQVSGYGAGELAPQRISDGTPVFIQKPFTAQALLEVVHAALDCPPAA